MDEDRLEALYTKHRSWLLARATNICGTLSDAEEAVQEAFARFVMKGGQTAMPSEGACVKWLITTTSRLCYDQLRRRERRQHAEVLLQTPEENVVDPDAPTHAPWESVTDEQLAEAVESLPPRLRETWQLGSLGLSYAEIARRQGITPGNVGKRLHDARRKLKRHFGETPN